MHVVGKVIVGVSAWGPRIRRFPEVFRRGLGVSLFPGTLNVQIAHPLPIIEDIRIPGSEIGEPDQDILFERCLIEGFQAFRLRPYQPATGLGGHGDHVLEIVSAHELRPALRRLDEVRIEFPLRDAETLGGES